jgi:hypothetical protein
MDHAVGVQPFFMYVDATCCDADSSRLDSINIGRFVKFFAELRKKRRKQNKKVGARLVQTQHTPYVRVAWPFLRPLSF